MVRFEMLRNWFKQSNYQDPDLVEVVFAKTVALEDASLFSFPASAGLDQTVLGVAYAASLIADRPLRVLDFGGACGFHHRVSGAALPHIATRWAIVETAAMAKRAAALATDSLQFFDRIPDAIDWLGDIDLMHSSGTLQCIGEPESVLTELCSIGARVLAWNRLSLSSGARVSVEQTSMLSENGPGPMPANFVDRQVSYARTEIPVGDFLAAHSRYRLMWKFSGDSVGYIFVRP